MASKKTFENAAIGFNHNITHRGRVYHVQTEDSGLGNPQVVTHLFLGGNIISSKKTSYAEVLNDPELSNRVRELMEAQHKRMLRNLVQDNFDQRRELTPSYQPGELGEPPEPSGTLGSPGNVQSALTKTDKTLVPLAGNSIPSYAKTVVDSTGWHDLDATFGSDLLTDRSLDEAILSYLESRPIEKP